MVVILLVNQTVATVGRRHQQDTLTVEVLGRETAPLVVWLAGALIRTTLKHPADRGLSGGRHRIRIVLLVLFLLEGAEILEILQQLEHQHLLLGLLTVHIVLK